MTKKPNALKRAEQENPFILSISDLMTVLMLTFALLFVGSLLLNKRLQLLNQKQGQALVQCKGQQQQCHTDLGQKLAECEAKQQQCNTDLDRCKTDYSVSTSLASNCQGQFEQCKQDKDKIDPELKECQKQLQSLKVLNAPQTISLKEAEGFTFDSGSGELSGIFTDKLADLLKTERAVNLLNNPRTKVIEIIGHTDNQPVKAWRSSTLDKEVINVLAGMSPIKSLQYGSNTDLGLIRAVSVYLYLKQLQADGQLRADLQFRIYSAGQLLLPSGQLAIANTEGIQENLDVQEKRRIELKFEALPETE